MKQRFDIVPPAFSIGNSSSLNDEEHLFTIFYQFKPNTNNNKPKPAFMPAKDDTKPVLQDLILRSVTSLHSQSPNHLPHLKSPKSCYFTNPSLKDAIFFCFFSFFTEF
ncbi:hypothetical protein MtrunA17_Chr5g0398371 [Medicago truncatula]|uniref:Uncharacterized protein n=1 Tax=Medicago truncatula TaxID=3880 RepID=A0A396HK25_MEDTR|nr:hypothetical protein MtrunA17_Chr5g0398371 [Medicago truncatula]